MEITRYQNFLSKQLLTNINNELLTSNRWRWIGDVWRYYIVDNLSTYQESDPNSWHGNNIKQLPNQWQQLFDQVYELAGSNFKLMRYALPGQVQYQNGVWHPDVSPDLPGTYVSYLMYLNPTWQNSWQGQTEFEVNKTIISEPVEPGKLVVFDSKLLHRGLGPSVSGVLRTNIVLHGQLF